MTPRHHAPGAGRAEARQRLCRQLRHFATDTSGAVMVDWVVLTAAIVGLSLAVMISAGGGLRSVGSKLGDHVASLKAGTDDTD